MARERRRDDEKKKFTGFRRRARKSTTATYVHRPPERLTTSDRQCGIAIARPMPGCRGSRAASAFVQHASAFLMAGVRPISSLGTRLSSILQLQPAGLPKKNSRFHASFERRVVAHCRRRATDEVIRWPE